jgi:hypothetical protein
MTVALCVVTDGRRQCIERSIPSLLANVRGPITHRVIHDDSGDPDYRSWLRHAFPTFDVIGPDHRHGYSAAYGNAWRHLAERPERFCFIHEDDFLYERPVDLLAMAELLDWRPYVAQVALRRQAWNEQEKAAGGVVEQHAGDYLDCSDGDMHWLEHRRFLTTNPSLIRTELCKVGWPQVPHSEGTLTHLLIADPGLRFAYWGRRTDAPWVTHIGTDRVGTGY